MKTYNFTLRQIQYIVAVAEMMSFRRAAERCNVSQPSLSAQVAEIEAALGVPLFERDRRGVLVTAAGQELIGRARRGLGGGGGFPRTPPLFFRSSSGNASCYSMKDIVSATRFWNIAPEAKWRNWASAPPACRLWHRWFPVAPASHCCQTLPFRPKLSARNWRFAYFRGLLHSARLCSDG